MTPISPATFSIDTLGSAGDGLATLEGRRVFVPGALPGEQVRASLAGERAERVQILTPSPDRASPVCRHFGVCGGCVLQHAALGGEAYRAWKRDLVAHALLGRGIEIEISGPFVAPLGSRRRAAFSALHSDQGIVLGFHAAGSHSILDLAECPVLLPEIAAALPLLRRLLAELLPRKAASKVTVTKFDHGLDVALAGGVEADRARRLQVVSELLERDRSIVRLSVDGQQLLRFSDPRLTVAGVAVEPPPAAFLQAVAESEATMTGLVGDALAAGLRKVRKPRIADFFAGVGTFAFAAAKHGEVDAFEYDKPAVAALERAAAGAKGRKAIRAHRRDLFREPLGLMELKDFAAAVLDPPRAGAEAQIETLAKSKVPLVVMVSCYPPTLARDLKSLIDGGYRLTSVTAVDQFIYSAHVESIAVLEKKSP